jgi:hypothetical protein
MPCNFQKKVFWRVWKINKIGGLISQKSAVWALFANDGAQGMHVHLFVKATEMLPPCQGDLRDP